MAGSVQAKLMPSDAVVRDAVARVLREAATGKGNIPCFLTAYQILDRLPADLRAQLIAERQRGGKGEGVRYAAASLVSDAAELLPGIEIAYLDTAGLQIQIRGDLVEAGNRVCGLYRCEPK